MKKNIFIVFGVLWLLSLVSCAQPPLQGEVFEEVVIRNASKDTLTSVQLKVEKGSKNKALQTNAIYPFSQMSLGFSPRKTQRPDVTLLWQQAGRTYSKDLVPYFIPVEDKKESHVLTVIIANGGNVQVTVEPVR